MSIRTIWGAPAPDWRTRLSRRFALRYSTLDYAVHLDDVRRIAYFETPKVACTSIKKYMMDQRAGSRVFLPDKGAVHDRSHSPLRALSDLPARDQRAVLGYGWRRFTFIRNPFTRFLSAYLDKLVQNDWERRRLLPQLGFAPDARPGPTEVLRHLAHMPDADRDVHFMTQAGLTGAVGRLDFVWLGCFERFDRDFLAFKRALYSDASDDTYAQFGRHHASDAGAKLSLYDDAEARSLLLHIYGCDFALFGYSVRLKDALRPPTLSADLHRQRLQEYAQGVRSPFRSG